ncbi:MAG TPA: rhodanese-related sulfurtransferase [Candidatus Paceibacterota bacterium]
MTEAAQNPYEIILYYKYVDLADPQGFVDWHKAVCANLNLKGRVLIAKEGINGTLEGRVEDTAEYCRLMHLQDGSEGTFADFSDVVFKRSPGTGVAFPKLKVKLRDEVVSLKLSHGSDVNPNETTGIHLKAEDLKKWYETGEDFLIVDMRNDYEYKVGHFEGSINPKMTNFRDLPDVLPALEEVKKASLEGKKIITVCTGGIRCEKASGFLMKNGFENVYQLDGGMHTYMEKFPGQDFNGALYVFDGRETMAFTDDRQIIGRCIACDTATEQFTNCAHIRCHAKTLICGPCIKKSLAEARTLVEENPAFGPVVNKILTEETSAFVFCSDECRAAAMERIEKAAKASSAVPVAAIVGA